MAERTQVDIVRLTPDDWPVYRDLRVAGLTQDAFAFGSTLERENQLGEADLRARLQRRAMFAARVGDQYLGLVGGQTADEQGTADLLSMWVEPQARRAGVGGALVRAVIDWAREQGFHQVKLWFTEGNEPAERLYLRHGFKLTGERQHIRPNDPDHWELEMVCELRGVRR